MLFPKTKAGGDIRKIGNKTLREEIVDAMFREPNFPTERVLRGEKNRETMTSKKETKKISLLLQVFPVYTLHHSPVNRCVFILFTLFPIILTNRSSEKKTHSNWGKTSQQGER